MLYCNRYFFMFQICLLATSHIITSQVSNVATLASNHNISQHDYLNNLMKTEELIILRFNGENCPQCHSTDALFNKIAQRYNNRIKFLDVNHKEIDTLTKFYSVKTLPTFLFLKKGEVVARYNGARDLRMESLEFGIKNYFRISPLTPVTN